MLTYEQALAETAEQRVIMRAMLATLKEVEAQCDDPMALDHLRKIIAQAEAAGITADADLTGPDRANIGGATPGASSVLAEED